MSLALIQGIKKLPPTLKTFHFSELYNPFMDKEIKAVDLLLGENDMLTPTMRELSAVTGAKADRVSYCPRLSMASRSHGKQQAVQQRFFGLILKPLTSAPYLPTGKSSFVLFYSIFLP
jgi:hypothetical protein